MGSWSSGSGREGRQQLALGWQVHGALGSRTASGWHLDGMCTGQGGRLGISWHLGCRCPGRGNRSSSTWHWG